MTTPAPIPAHMDTVVRLKVLAATLPQGAARDLVSQAASAIAELVTDVQVRERGLEQLCSSMETITNTLTKLAELSEKIDSAGGPATMMKRMEHLALDAQRYAFIRSVENEVEGLVKMLADHSLDAAVDRAMQHKTAHAAGHH